jgi:MinD superfamily P-loop ATPase
MKEKYVGEIVQGNLGQHHFIAGDLDLESEFQVPLIKAIHERLNPEAICICDFGPGTDLPVSLAINEMDIAIIVVQITPDWKQHLNDMLSIARKSNIHTGLVINKMEEFSTFPSEVEEYCSLKSLPIWGIIPHFGTLENNNDFRNHNSPKVMILPVSTIWDSITKSHPSFQTAYNETFTQH